MHSKSRRPGTNTALQPSRARGLFQSQEGCWREAQPLTTVRGWGHSYCFLLRFIRAFVKIFVCPPQVSRLQGKKPEDRAEAPPRVTQRLEALPGAPGPRGP